MEETNSASSRLKTIDDILDGYEQKLGLPKYTSEFSQSAEIGKLLNLSREIMETMQPEDCVQSRIILTSFAAHLQQSLNRELSRISWADAQLRKHATPRIQQYRTNGSWEQTFALAVLGDEYTSKIQDIRDYAKQRADRLSFLASSIRSVADTLQDLERSKRVKYGKD